MIFFSVVIPTYNRAELIAQAIRAVLEQTFSDFEIIVVDDGSTDDTADVVGRFQDPRVHYFKKENSERGAARNFGAVRATGKYINFFDSDDLMYPHHLTVAHDFALANGQPEFFNVGYDILDDSGKCLGRETNFNYDLADRLIVTNFLGCDSVFVRQDIFRNNLFNEDRRMASSEDWELWLRMISRYPLHSCDTITLALSNHSARSLFTISPDKILERDTIMTNHLLQDNAFVMKFRKQIPLFKADRFTFFALHMALAGNRKKDTLHYLVRSLISSPQVLKRKRFWASLNLMVSSYFKKSDG